MFEIGIVTDEISLDIKESIEIGLKLGIKSYELRCVGSYEKRVPFIDEGDLNYILKETSAGRIKITALSPGIFKIKPSDSEKLKFEIDETLPKTFKLAKKLNVEKIIIFGFIRDGTPEDFVVNILKDVAKLAKEENFKLAIENEPGFYCDTGANTASILEKVGAENLGANWDPANAIGAGEFAFPIGYERIKKFVFNIHVKDAVNHPEFKCSLVGDGSVNWFGQLKAIARDKLVDTITIETHYLPLVDSTIENLKRIRAILKAIEEIER
jgi:sugar phosphate isomerase/epimerase